VKLRETISPATIFVRAHAFPLENSLVLNLPPSAPERTLQASGQGQAIGRPKGGSPRCSVPASTTRWAASGAKPLPKKQRRKRRSFDPIADKTKYPSSTLREGAKAHSEKSRK
jgi:hypothetical protein